MQLTAAQLKAFDDQGYIFMPNCFADEEVALMRSEGAKEAPLAFAQKRAPVWQAR